MDYTQILHTLQNAIPTGIWYLIPLFFLAVVIKLHWFKSNAGEAMVNLSARFYLDRTWGGCGGGAGEFLGCKAFPRCRENC